MSKDIGTVRFILITSLFMLLQKYWTINMMKNVIYGPVESFSMCYYVDIPPLLEGLFI